MGKTRRPSRILRSTGFGWGFAARGAALAVVGVMALAAPASAGSVWDPDDAAGRLDIRWMGAVFVDANDTLRLTISFYEDFSATALPLMKDRRDMYAAGRGWVGFSLIDYYSAFLARRRDGAVIFAQPERTDEFLRVRVVSPHVLRVWIPAFTTGELDIESTSYFLQASSYWDSRGRERRDRTAAIHLPVPRG
jgi:hypothetical protein